MSKILGLNVQATNYSRVVDQSLRWARNAESRSVVFANVHMVMEGFDKPGYKSCLDRVDIINPDGMPLVWALRLMGNKDACRVYGPDCMLIMLRRAEEEGVPVGFYGGTEDSLHRLCLQLKDRYPNLQIRFQMAPPFRELSIEEDAAVSHAIQASGIRILFVGLGCPKQEKWIDQHVGRISAVMFGVGAAFDFLSGTKSQAPRWMMASGLEWIFRLASEPRRLAGRYIKNNPRFVVEVLRQLVGNNRIAKNRAGI